MPDPDSSALLTLRCPKGIDRKRVRAFLQRLTGEVTGGAPFTVLLTDDRELRRLNAMFLGKDYATDVLSFPGGEGDLGEMAISVDRAREQAAEHGHTVEEEIEILMLHGALHLSGMDHEVDRGQMRRAETQWRKKLGLATGLIERARR